MAIVIENKYGGRVTKTKEINKDGVNIGVIEGYGATWDLDRGDWTGVKDQFAPGAFLESIARHKETNRPIRLKDMHGRTVGGFPINTVHEDSKGLFGIGEVNLDVQQGAELYSLAKQGVLTDFSIGWQDLDSTIEGKVRTIRKSEIWELSIVDEPMNPKANITAVKNLDFSELDPSDMRGIEEALTKGVKFPNRLAKQIIHLMKESGLLRDEQEEDDDGKLMKELDNILKTINRR